MSKRNARPMLKRRVRRNISQEEFEAALIRFGGMYGCGYPDNVSDADLRGKPKAEFEVQLKIEKVTRGKPPPPWDDEVKA